MEQTVIEIKAKIHYDSNRNQIGFVIVMLGFMAALFIGCLQFTKLFSREKWNIDQEILYVLKNIFTFSLKYENTIFSEYWRLIDTLYIEKQ